jgi:peroxiredoxin
VIGFRRNTRPAMPPTKAIARRRAVAARGLATAVAALVVATSVGAGPAKPASDARLAMSPERVRETLRRHTLRTLDGRTLRLSDYDGQVVVVNFWASWCAPCRKELPRLDALNAELAKRGGRVIAVSIDEDAQNVARFVQNHHLTLPVAHDGPDGLARDLDLPHVPMTIVLDRSGSLAYTSSGADEHSLAALDDVTRRLVATGGTTAGDVR